MIARYGPGSGCILELILGFGVGGGTLGNSVASGGFGKLDFSRAGNSGLIVILRRF